jgi:uncharacterized protein (TIGR02118 family)
MIKLIALIKRRADLTLEEFAEYYEHRHMPLVARSLPPEVGAAIVHYEQNHAVQLGSGRTEPAYDCVTEFTFHDVAGVRLWSDWYNGPGGAVLRDDEEHFMDKSRRVVIVADERTPAYRA